MRPSSDGFQLCVPDKYHAAQLPEFTDAMSPYLLPRYCRGHGECSSTWLLRWLPVWTVSGMRRCCWTDTQIFKWVRPWAFGSLGDTSRKRKGLWMLDPWPWVTVFKPAQSVMAFFLTTVPLTVTSVSCLSAIHTRPFHPLEEWVMLIYTWCFLYFMLLTWTPPLALPSFFSGYPTMASNGNTAFTVQLF